jgi:hypothetical protein
MRILKWFSRSSIAAKTHVLPSFFQWKPGRQSWSVFNSELVKSSSLVDEIVGCHVGCIASRPGGPGDSILEANSIALDRWIHAGSDEPCPAGATLGSDVQRVRLSGLMFPVFG